MSQPRCGIPIPVVNPPDFGAGQRCVSACSLAYPANVPVDNRTSAGAAIATFDYRYDHVGNPTSMVEASGDRVTLSYDADNKLLAERVTGQKCDHNSDGNT